MKRKVEWRRWKDPFLHDRPQDDDDELDDGYEHEEFGGRQSPFRGTYAATPAGFFPLEEANIPSRQFSFWVGDANFDVDDRVFRAAERVPGVEILQALTRYRFWMGVGRSFHDERVKDAVTEAMVSAATPPGPPKVWAVVQFDSEAIRVVGRTKSDIKKLSRGGRVLATSWGKNELFKANPAGGDGPGIRGGLGGPGQQEPPQVDFPEVREPD